MVDEHMKVYKLVLARIISMNKIEKELMVKDSRTLTVMNTGYELNLEVIKKEYALEKRAQEISKGYQTAVILDNQEITYYSLELTLWEYIKEVIFNIEVRSNYTTKIR